MRSWGLRLIVAQAAIALIVARLLVRLVRLSHWRSTIGQIVEQPNSPISPAPISSGATISPNMNHGPRRDDAFRIARCVNRGAHLLPFETKCLPRAIATQWLLRLRGIASQLVIAVHRTDRTGDHAFHAWVEHEGELIIGHCDRSEYRPTMILAQGAAAAPAAGPNQC